MNPFFQSDHPDITVSHGEGGTFPEHLHTHVEFIYITRGQLRFGIDRCMSTLKEGDMAVVFPNVLHSYEGRSPDTEITMVICHPGVLREFYEDFMKKRPLSPVVRGESIHPDVRYAMKGLRSEAETGGNQEVMRAFLHLIFSRIMGLLKPETPPQRTEHTLFYQAVDYLSSHYAEPITLESTAFALGVTPTHLSHVFGRNMHLSFRAYINSLRVASARTLLRTTDYSVTEVCYECGFTSLRTFDRAFTGVCGISPRDYRKSPPELIS